MESISYLDVNMIQNLLCRKPLLRDFCVMCGGGECLHDLYDGDANSVIAHSLYGRYESIYLKLQPLRELLSFKFSEFVKRVFGVDIEGLEFDLGNGYILYVHSNVYHHVRNGYDVSNIDSILSGVSLMLKRADFDLYHPSFDNPVVPIMSFSGALNADECDKFLARLWNAARRLSERAIGDIVIRSDDPHYDLVDSLLNYLDSVQ